MDNDLSMRMRGKELFRNTKSNTNSVGDIKDPSTQAGKLYHFLGSLVNACSLLCFFCALIYCNTKTDLPFSDLMTVYKTGNVIIYHKASLSCVILLFSICCMST